MVSIEKTLGDGEIDDADYRARDVTGSVIVCGYLGALNEYNEANCEA